MDQLLQFAGHFWWLIFPLMGVAGGAAKAWERGARARHERRLEVLHAKAELKAAARAGAAGLPPIATARATDADAGAPDRTAVERLFAAHDGVTHRWLDYELDVAKLIAYPAMSDGRQPLTAAFLRAKKVADGLRPASAAKVSPLQLNEYREAVTDYEVAFDLAERDAKRLKDSGFSPDERKRLDTAKQLLGVAVDQAATPAERQLAYRRVRDELDGLLSLSDGAIDELERRVALELPAGTGAADGAAEATAAQPAPPAAPTGQPVPTGGQPPQPLLRPPPSSPGRIVRPKPRS